ncbi:MAG: gliding motility protein GldL [Chitinophagaceae bacterium]|nr:MAG: gliding motility protein GldL [Chitinophagaceae bacterium]
MAKGKSFFHSRGFKIVMSRIYGLGAAVVIIGALFKILHWKGANEMLMVGLLTEAGIFAISAFEPVKEEVDWTLVYPELAGMDPKEKNKKDDKKSLTSELDKMLAEARIEQGMVNRLGEGLRSLTENVNNLGTMSSAAAATNEYAEKVKAASGNVGQLNQAYTNAIAAIEQMSQGSDVSAEYYAQVSSVTQKLASLNSVYEMELQESNNHIKQLNSFYAGLSKAVENLSDAEGATSQLRNEFNNLNQNLHTLNTVYGNMLSAMTAPRV